MFKGKISGKLVVAFGVIALLCIYIFTQTTEQPSSSIELVEPNSKVVNASNKSTQALKNATTSTLDADITKKGTADEALARLTLLAVVMAQPVNNSSALIGSGNNRSNYDIGDKILNSPASLSAVFASYVLVNIDGEDYRLVLVGDEQDTLLSAADSQTAPQDDYLAMTAEDIGNRPKLLTHILSIDPNNNDYRVSPGVNPQLLRAAKFKPGDELLTINGKDVSIPEEYAQAQALIATAQTLEFEVLRNGQIVTLYLDIPNEDLSIAPK
jgi:general secretion pathway protein C